jgi:hypothetical protein
MKQLSALLLSHSRGALQGDFPAFPVFPAERLVWRQKSRPYRLGLDSEPNRRDCDQSDCMIRIDDEKER